MYPPDKRKRDVDNVLKALLDALRVGGAYSDDSQIGRLLIERKAPKKGGEVIVRISEQGKPQNGGKRI
jgi:crossover junction endodeoxyribonuclease RusA